MLFGKYAAIKAIIKQKIIFTIELKKSVRYEKLYKFTTS